MLRHAHFYMMGGNRTFAAPPTKIGQLEESGRSGLRTSFFDVQMQLTAAVSPYCNLHTKGYRVPFLEGTVVVD